MHCCLAPTLASACTKTTFVECFCYFFASFTIQCHVKYAADSLYRNRIFWLWFQLVAGFVSIANCYLAITIGCPAAGVKATLGILSHTPPDILTEILTVEFVYGLNDTF